MNIIACIKQVPYPDTPASAYRINDAANAIVLPDDTPLVISPFDENALEAGLQLKDKTAGKLTVITLATRSAEVVTRDLKQAIAMGADEAILLDDPAFSGGDSWSTSYSLAMAIRKIGEYDLILCGLQAADWDAGQVALGIAEFLGIPAATSCTAIEKGEGCVQVKCLIENGYDIIELPLPSVVAIVSDASLMPRIAPLPGIIKAKKRKIPVWAAADIMADYSETGASGAKTAIKTLAIPKIESICEFIKAENPDDVAAELILKLKSAKVL